MVARPSGPGGRCCLLRLAHVRPRHESRTHRRLCARRRIGNRIRRLFACIFGIRERDATFYRSESGAGTQILKDNVVRRKQVCQRLASEAVHADNARTRDRVAYQSLHRADQKGGQRTLPERLFVLLEIKRSAGMMTGFWYWLHAQVQANFLLLPSYLLLG